MHILVAYILQDEYLKAYYAALVKRQEEEEASRRIQQQTELSTSAAEEPVDRRVGMKSKREDDEDIEWESAAGTGMNWPLDFTEFFFHLLSGFS